MSPLRIAVALLGAVMLSGAVVGFLDGAPLPPMAMAGITGALFLIGTLLERNRYKPLRNTEPGPGWRRGQERFIDPDTGRTVSVWHNDSTGERQYVSEEGSGPG